MYTAQQIFKRYGLDMHYKNSYLIENNMNIELRYINSNKVTSEEVA